MKIIYIANHGKQDNDDEGAITHALRALGHEVETVLEMRLVHLNSDVKGDFAIFHHPQGKDIEALGQLRLPKVFWCFDLIDAPGDRTLDRRSQRRKEWIGQLTAACDLGFMTDGDWVAQDQTGKLVWLMQGADERVAGFGRREDPKSAFPRIILFAGIAGGGGRLRETFVGEMRRHYAVAFDHVSKGVWREALRDRIAEADAVVAPDGPVTGRYWSNRVYLTCGFGGFLLHPFCSRLREHYRGGTEVVYYHTREELHDLIRFYLEPGRGERRAIARAGHERTLREHLYRHRCERLVAVAKERLGL